MEREKEENQVNQQLVRLLKEVTWKIKITCRVVSLGTQKTVLCAGKER